MSIKPRKNNTNKTFKPRNLNFYYSNLYIEYYNFSWQYEAHFEIIVIKSHKYIIFAKDFLKGYIFNYW